MAFIIIIECIGSFEARALFSDVPLDVFAHHVRKHKHQASIRHTIKSPNHLLYKIGLFKEESIFYRTQPSQR